MIPIDQLIRSRRKTVALIVEQDGRLVVRAPLRTPAKVIQAFVDSKADWIRKKQAAARETFVPSRRYQPGELFHYLGQVYPLALTDRKSPQLLLADGQFSLSHTALPEAPETFRRWYRRQARAYLTERVPILADLHGFAYKKIRITSARTRWGSCSSTGSLNFSMRLVMAPPVVLDYVILHELAHTRVRNHSRQFWALVQSLMPDYKKHTRWLKENGRTLYL